MLGVCYCSSSSSLRIRVSMSLRVCVCVYECLCVNRAERTCKFSEPDDQKVCQHPGTLQAHQHLDLCYKAKVYCIFGSTNAQRHLSLKKVIEAIWWGGNVEGFSKDITLEAEVAAVTLCSHGTYVHVTRPAPAAKHLLPRSLSSIYRKLSGGQMASHASFYCIQSLQ